MHDRAIAEIEKSLEDIDNEMTEIFERNRYLNSLMEARKQKEPLTSEVAGVSTPPPNNQERLLGSPFQPTPSEIPPPTPLTIRSKRVNDSPTHKEHEGIPSKRREIMPNEMNPLVGELEELEDVLSRNDKAQGLDPRLIIHGKRRRGQKQ